MFNDASESIWQRILNARCHVEDMEAVCSYTWVTPPLLDHVEEVLTYDLCMISVEDLGD